MSPQAVASLTEPRSIVQSLTTKFQAGPDISSIQRIDSLYERVVNERAHKLAQSRDNLHQWMKKVEGAKWEAQRPADRSESAHQERMSQLDRDRYNLVKLVNELELSIQREESTKLQLSNKLATIQGRVEWLNGMGKNVSKDGIRSMVYKELGICWALEDLQDHEDWRKSATVKCRIHSKRSNDVFTFELHPNSVNPFDDAQQLWLSLSK